MILHGYWRSGTSYRTRIALNLKGVAYEQRTHDLRQGEQKSETYLALNPQGLVPALEHQGWVVTQSLAILGWLDERFPEPPLLPRTSPEDRAEVRAMATLVACDIHPLNNLRVLKAVKGLGGDTDAWAEQWIRPGFDALERLIEQRGGGWSWGEAPTIADCCLIPQVYSARRFNVDVSAWPLISAVDARAQQHPAFQDAHPDVQPDADGA
ncbi:maleylacetoacetate isomerase [Brevundimonas sp.]|uniref:maleylacetoacetate isomerase n=1 Tax=Brevundimonas sp. TaxID=1871086 RepID=UPI0025D8CB1D|nr:maleylacetoacetate isomerase [Brevundimonas sp.]